MKTFSAFAATLAITLLATTPPALSQGIDWKQGKLGSLSDTIGTYRVEDVLDNPVVKQKLLAAGGPALPAKLKADLTVTGPIDFINGNLVLRGNAPHGGMSDLAVLSVAPFDGRIAYAVLVNGRILSGGDHLQDDAQSHGPVTTEIKRWQTGILRR